jgi:hypothetical protein
MEKDIETIISKEEHNPSCVDETFIIIREGDMIHYSYEHTNCQEDDFCDYYYGTMPLDSYSSEIKNLKKNGKCRLVSSDGGSLNLLAGKGYVQADFKSQNRGLGQYFYGLTPDDFIPKSLKESFDFSMD